MIRMGMDPGPYGIGPMEGMDPMEGKECLWKECLWKVKECL